MRLPSPALFRRLLGSTQRIILQNPRQAITFLFIIIPSILYFTLWRLTKSKYGRWYWNYGVSFHPVMIYLLPKDGWDPIDRPPRWIQEIYEAPWMGEWEIPELSRPIHRQEIIDTSSSHSAFIASSHTEKNGIVYTPSRSLISRVIVKLDVFSTVSYESQAKRRLIPRTLASPQYPSAIPTSDRAQICTRSRLQRRLVGRRGDGSVTWRGTGGVWGFNEVGFGAWGEFEGGEDFGLDSCGWEW